jgi:hypothetical protein
VQVEVKTVLPVLLYCLLNCACRVGGTSGIGGITGGIMGDDDGVLSPSASVPARLVERVVRAAARPGLQ